MYSGYFIHAARMEFRRLFKREFYGYLYSSAVCEKQFNDFTAMYLMGGEL